MENPYRSLPDAAFWRRSVAACPGDSVDPVVDIPFRLFRRDRIATAGSCFAQHLSRELRAAGFAPIVAEGNPPDPRDVAAHAAFSAAYGNIYTARQLLQLFERAFGLRDPHDTAWRRADGRYVDPFRPTMYTAGFDSPEAVATARVGHLDAVCRMFETCDVFIFTLGLTECWIADADGAVFPITPGVEADPGSGAYRFHNMTVEEVVDDMRRLLAMLREVNPRVRVLLTVSPVPLIATYVSRHVLVSTIASKAILRVAADMLSESEPDLAYFPSYEIITGPQARGRYFEADLRSITADGVAHVMRVFSRHYLTTDDDDRRPPDEQPCRAIDEADVAGSLQRLQALGRIICDEELLDPERSAQ
ncbi:GSCFA domain-containing protein [Sphingomonas sp. TREG-RG-20F-R18-01]|uniref:GSCFA domain-containing protein n=1 Tax=Sphingomonas sp. TREG-RG-20F-R18-01 TaxID=2914982 RepID=UPI001F5603B9|nr:GSCFA domain-containing protein [Sphingomonas sp. TREG-RG-20F-R18-01]